MDDLVSHLEGLSGWDWNQYGEVALVVQGAYRDKDDRLQVFRCVAAGAFISPLLMGSITATEHPVPPLSAMVPDYEKQEEYFETWANRALLSEYHSVYSWPI